MVLKVLVFPDPKLRIACKPVEKVTDELGKFANDMLDTMYDQHGVGLSAIQVDRHIRVLVTDTRPRDNQDRYDVQGMTELEEKVPQPLILFNPEIIDRKGKTTFKEGCLSLPTYFEDVDRFEWVKVKGLDQKGKPMEFETDGLLSICIQHEVDHLDGKLFIDRLSSLKANRIREKIKKYGYPVDTNNKQVR